MTGEPFGRQPKPVKVSLEGDSIDVEHWLRYFRRVVERDGDNTNLHKNHSFTIYPRAVND